MPALPHALRRLVFHPSLGEPELDLWEKPGEDGRLGYMAEKQGWDGRSDSGEEGALEGAGECA